MGCPAGAPPSDPETTDQPGVTRTQVNSPSHGPHAIPLHPTMTWRWEGWHLNYSKKQARI